jgi:predicted O-methyltransferase YrrM
MKFQEALEKHFQFARNQTRDNLPIRAIERKRWGRRHDHGRASLARMMATLEFKEGVEIGTRTGESAEMWCAANPLLHLTCVDPYAAYSVRPDQERQDGNYAKALERLKPYNATIMRVRSMDAVPEFVDGSLDFVFIDGDHHFDHVVMDLVRWAPKVRKHGMVILHDYCIFEKAGIIKAVDAYTQSHRIDPWYVTHDFTPSAFWEKGVERAR